jgi:hypothetical protein
LIRQLAVRTGEMIADAVKGGVAEKRARAPLTDAEVAQRRARLEAILAKFGRDAHGRSSIRG